jgi:hypothetical protein
MASNKRALAICDTCGFQYPHRVLKMNSYGMLVCPTDYDGAYDLKNHPQNRTANVRDDESIRNPRPPLNNDRNLVWNNATNTWENYDTDWNMI